MNSKPFSLYMALFLVSIMVVSSCDRGVVFEENKKLPKMEWHYEDRVAFKAEIQDTTNLHNIYINVRNSVDYKYMNFYMFLDTEFPDGRVVRDTLECLLADNRGEWMGDGFGKIRSNQFLMRENVWFPVKGTYVFSFEQGMREEVLEGISDIGIRIEKK